MIRDAALRGKLVMVTQAGAPGRLAGALKSRGGKVWHVPLIEIRPPADWSDVDAALRDWARYDWVVFTSGNAVKPVVERLKHLGLANSLPASSPRPHIAAVGKTTARLLQSAGLPVKVCPADQRAEGLVSAIIEREPLAGKKVLFPKGNLARDTVAVSFGAAGADVRDVVVYHTVAAHIDADAVRRRLLSGEIHAVTFMSPSAVESFVAALGCDIWSSLPKSFVVASIGPTTSAALRDVARPPDVEAMQPSAESLADAVAALCA